MRLEIGTRVMAISHVEGDKVFAFGEGVYEGDFVPDDDACGFAEMAREYGMANPKIRLDSGDVIWGAECWWFPVEEAKDAMVGMEIVEVSIVEGRKAQRGS